MITTVIGLLDATRAYLTQFDVPAPWSVTVNAYLDEPNVTLQITCREPTELAAALLAWADTLTAVTAEAWRVPDGNSVHLSITGRLPCGEPLRIYGAVPVTEHGIGTDLAPDTATTIPLVALRHLATPGQAAI
ncbi:MAG: hypothetical protein M3460_25755 [Actinomycetota bacterium]|nr:hypothetical protein [Actinomycetota bacterium]